MPNAIREFFTRLDRERQQRAALMRSAAREVEARQRHLQRILDESEDEEASWNNTGPITAVGG